MFEGRHFDQSVILLCVRWYLAYKLSLRDLEEMMAVHIAMRLDWIEIDPTAAVEWRPAYTGWKAWPSEAMQKFEQRWPLGTAARTC